MTRTIDETMLTAYALGECSPDEAAEVQALLRRSPGARELVEQLQELAAIAEEALLEEPSLLDDQRQAILDAADARDQDQPAALPPVVTPVPLPPPTAVDKVVELQPRRRGIWALRASAVGAIAAVVVAAVLVPSLYTLNAPGGERAYGPVASSNDPAARVVASPDRAGADHGKRELLHELNAELQTTPEAADALRALGYIAEAPPTDGHNKNDEVERLRRAASMMVRKQNQSDGLEWNLQQEDDGERAIAARRGRDAKGQADANGERYNPISHNAFQLVTDAPLSTLSIDVDTASYANVRRFLEHHTLPPASAVRIEELINYFDYGYTPPSGDAPFATHVEIAGCPWAPEHRLVRVGVKGRVIDTGELPPSNLVFLLDVSGSMSAQNKLPLVQQAIQLLVHELDERDRVAIVVYAGSSGLVLPATSGDHPAAILGALGQLQAGGSTAGGAGIELAYQTAVANFVEGGINRVILATDGDFNVGVSDQGQLLELIEDRAKSGVFLTVLGFGTGNLQDGTMEQLADHGNGNYAYIDSIDEARKVLVTERGGTMATIAKDVKIQVEFNPLQVHAYRLIGYENRVLAAQDFADDSKDAGEIGAGHTVTALFEVVPAGADLAVPGAPILEYQKPMGTTAAAASGELMTVKLRYKQPDGERSQLLSFPITDGGAPWSNASTDLRHAAAVAAFGMLLRDSPYQGQATWELVAQLAAQGAARDPHGYRAEFRTLVRRAQELSGE